MTKEVGWDDIFKNVLNKRPDSHEVLGPGEPKAIPTVTRRLPSSGVTYVKLQPSKDLAILASTSDETIQAVKTLANALAHRGRFIGRYKCPEFSPAIRLVEGYYRRSSSGQSQVGPSGEHKTCSCGACTSFEGASKPYEGASKEPHFDPLSVKSPPACSAKFKFVDGVMQVFWKPGQNLENPPLLWEASALPTVREYLAALQDVMIAVQDPGTQLSNSPFAGSYNKAV